MNDEIMNGNGGAENTVADDGLDFSLFGGGEGVQLLSDEKLGEINKKLPKWDLEPPSKFVKK